MKFRAFLVPRAMLPISAHRVLLLAAKRLLSFSRQSFQGSPMCSTMSYGLRRWCRAKVAIVVEDSHCQETMPLGLSEAALKQRVCITQSVQMTVGSFSQRYTLLHYFIGISLHLATFTVRKKSREKSGITVVCRESLYLYTTTEKTYLLLRNVQSRDLSTVRKYTCLTRALY